MLSESTAPAPARVSSPRAAPRAVAGRRANSRFKLLLGGLVIVSALAYIIFSAIQGGSEYYLTTSELKAMGAAAIDRQVKVGGQAVEGTVQRGPGPDAIRFAITDGSETIPVSFRGVVPDSFEAGGQAIVEGKLAADGEFRATTLLAKCASKYEPE